MEKCFIKVQQTYKDGSNPGLINLNHVKRISLYPEKNEACIYFAVQPNIYNHREKKDGDVEVREIEDYIWVKYKDFDAFMKKFEHLIITE